MDLDSIADLQSLTTILARRGYSDSDIAGIMHGNWIRSCPSPYRNRNSVSGE